jgi:hypothetical protein
MPTAAELDLTARQGSYFSKEIDIGALPVDLTASGTIIRMQIRDKKTSADPELTISTGADGRITVGGTATFTIYVSAVDMATIGTPGKDFTGFYDLEIVPQGVEAGAFALLAGAFTVAGEVTRA